jgi:hypothetical protein
LFKDEETGTSLKLDSDANKSKPEYVSEADASPSGYLFKDADEALWVQGNPEK